MSETPMQIPEDHNDRVALIAATPGLEMPNPRTKENVLAVLEAHVKGQGTPPAAKTDGKAPAVEKRARLVGMKAICAYIGRTEVTVLKYVAELDLPAAKIGGIWEADPAAIDAWRHKQNER